MVSTYSAIHAKKAFLFDLDGTLVDSAELHARAFRAALERHAPHLVDEFVYERWMGHPTLSVFSTMGIPADLALKLTEDKQQLYLRSVRTGQLRLLPGARDVLELLYKKDKGLWLVTGGGPHSVQEVLTQTGMSHYFQGVITSADTASGKPNPDPYLECLKRYNLQPADSIVIEDSTDGIEAAKRAGIDTIRVNSVSEMLCCSFTDLFEFHRFLREKVF